jgi:hypothetical protein
VRRGALACAALAVSGCAGSAPAPASEPLVASDPVPAWVRTPTAGPSELCAVGAVDRTYFAQDAHRLAAEAARAELARTIEVRVESVMLDYQSTEGSWVRRSDVVSVVESVADGVVHGAEVRATWRDDRGAVLAPGMTYALACLRTDAPVEQLADALRATAGDREGEVEAVRGRAQAAFEALAKAEAESEARAGAETGSASPPRMNEPSGSRVPAPEEVP